MIITRTPFRISLFGGGTDHPEWFLNESGGVISFSINKYCYISLREFPPFFDHKFRISYSKIERADSVDSIEHPAVREAVRKYIPNKRLELHHYADLPARSGVGSSSAFAVGLIKGIHRLTERSVENKQVATEAIELERNILKETVGYQDQIACALGGLNKINFNTDGSWNYNKFENEQKIINAIEQSCVLVFSGISRDSSQVSKSLVENISLKNKQFRRLNELTQYAEKKLLESTDFSFIGQLLSEGWELKKESNPASVTEEMQNLYDLGLKNGALGGKVLGAGGGGFMLFWVYPEMRNSFIEALAPHHVVPFKISLQGSEILAEL